MWEPFRLSIEQWAPNCRIVYDKFHMHAARQQSHGRGAAGGVFPQGRADARGGERQAVAAAEPLDEPDARQAAGAEPAVRHSTGRVFKAYLLKESLERLWTYRYEGAMLNYLNEWIDQLRWQRLEPFQKLAADAAGSPRRHPELLPDQSALWAWWKPSTAISSLLLRRGRGYKNLRYLLLKAQRMAATKTEFVVFRKAA